MNKQLPSYIENELADKLNGSMFLAEEISRETDNEIVYFVKGKMGNKPYVFRVVVKKEVAT